jgi:acyl-CoA dehydrogenase
MSQVDLNLQTMIGDTARRIFNDHINRKLLEEFEGGVFCAPLWQQIRDAGFALTLVPEAAGGVGGQWGDAAELLFAAGAFNLPLPLAETMIGNSLLAGAGIPLPDTEKPLAVLERGQYAQLELFNERGVVSMSGAARAVAWARDCDWLVVSNPLVPGQVQVALVDLRQPKAITFKRGQNLAQEPRDDLSFDRASCAAQAIMTSSTLAQPVLQLGALARSAMISGALKQVLDMTVRYANERIQFGKPIGKNQAIQQPLAMMAGEAGAAQMASRVALNSVQGFDIAVAKVRNGQAATQANGIVHQVHGAIGFTYEHMLHFSTRRLWSWRNDYGSDIYWARALGKAAIAEGGAGFWPSVAGRSLIPEL